MRSELGSITKRGKGTWQIRITVGTDPETGKQRRKTKTVHGTKKDAREAMNAMLALYTGAPYADMTLRAFVQDMYLPWHDQEYPRKDATNKLHYAFGQILDDIGDMRVGDMNRAWAERWTQDNSLWKVNKMRAAMRKAYEWEVVQRNPFDGVRKPAPEPDKRRLSAAQLAAVLDEVRDTAIEPGVILQASCGLREAEALALDWTAIDFERGKVRIDSTWHYDRGRGWFEPPKNRTSRGTVTIPADALARLKEIRTGGGVIRKGPIMLAPRNGGRMSPSTYSSIWRRLMRPLLGEDYVPVENLRHTHASLLLDAGASMEQIRDRLRHSSIKIAERYYAKSDGTLEEQAAEIFDEIDIGDEGAA